MLVVAIYGWQETTDELAAMLARVLGISPFEAKQRLLARGPAVIANFAAHEPAEQLAVRLGRCGLNTLVLDTTDPRGSAETYTAKNFRFGQRVLRIETCEGPTADVPYSKVSLLLAATHIMPALTETTTEKKISMKRTVLAGGIPRTKESTTLTTLREEQRQELLYLQAGRRATFIFRQFEISFAGHGSNLQLTSERNMALLKQRLRNHCPQLRYDERLLTRSGQVRLLGPRLAPELYFDLALKLLTQCLKKSSGE